MSNITMRILKLLAKHDSCEDVTWSFEGELVTFFINCNDLFYWACADAEPITDKNIGMLEKSYSDASNYENGEIYASLLFCCRERNMQPQGAYYREIPEDLWPLFNNCGPDRDNEKGNTQKPKAKLAKSE